MGEPLDLTRRNFLRIAALGGITAAIAACAPSAPTPAAKINADPIPTRIPPPNGEQLEEYGKKLDQIFYKAYLQESKGKQSVIDTLEDEFYYAATRGNDPVSRALKAQIQGFITDSLEPPQKKAYEMNPNDSQSYEWWWWMEAVKRLYRASGYAVLSMPVSSDGLPKMFIYKLPEGKRIPQNTQPYGVRIGDYDIVEIDGQAKTIVDSSSFLPDWQHPEEFANKDDHEIWLFKQTIQDNINLLKRIAGGGEFDRQEQNPLPNDKGAKKIRTAAQEILQSLINNNLDTTYITLIKEHASAHLITQPALSLVFDEQRSYTYQLLNTDPNVVCVSLAEFLLFLSSRFNIEQATSTQIVSTNPTNGGIQSTMIDFIKVLREDRAILDKLGQPPNGMKIEREEKDPANKYLPGSRLTNEYTEFILSNLDKLEGVNINKVAKRIVEMHRQEWLPQGSTNKLTRPEFIQLTVSALMNPKAFLMALL